MDIALRYSYAAPSWAVCVCVCMCVCSLLATGSMQCFHILYTSASVYYTEELLYRYMPVALLVAVGSMLAYIHIIWKHFYIYIQALLNLFRNTYIYTICCALVDIGSMPGGSHDQALGVRGMWIWKYGKCKCEIYIFGIWNVEYATM